LTRAVTRKSAVKLSHREAAGDPTALAGSRTLLQPLARFLGAVPGVLQQIMRIADRIFKPFLPRGEPDRQLVATLLFW